MRNQAPHARSSAECSCSRPAHQFVVSDTAKPVPIISRDLRATSNAVFQLIPVFRELKSAYARAGYKKIIAIMRVSPYATHATAA